MGFEDHAAVHPVREGRPTGRHRHRGPRRRGGDGRDRGGVRRDQGGGHFTDSAGLAHGIAAYAGRAAGAVFAVALLDASVIGAFAVSLSSAYAIGDVLGLNHSLHRGVRQAKGFYAVYALLIAVSGTIVLIPGSPLGLLTEGVQVLAGVLLPSATVFLLLLCNDRAVLGPWVNGPATNAFTSAVVAVLVTLSVVLTASVLFPSVSARQIVVIMAVCASASVAAGAWAVARRHRSPAAPIGRHGREAWRMPPLNMLSAPLLSGGRKAGLAALRAYLAVAMILVIVKIASIALGH